MILLEKTLNEATAGLANALALKGHPLQQSDFSSCPQEAELAIIGNSDHLGFKASKIFKDVKFLFVNCSPPYEWKGSKNEIKIDKSGIIDNVQHYPEDLIISEKLGSFLYLVNKPNKMYIYDICAGPASICYMENYIGDASINEALAIALNSSSVETDLALFANLFQHYAGINKQKTYTNVLEELKLV